MSPTRRNSRSARPFEDVVAALLQVSPTGIAEKHRRVDTADEKSTPSESPTSPNLED